ncbi:MAG: sugar phosphate isomerase/epimerase [Candidatus Latescibacteria bacterium]|nr:sugar phosphate isomerase/epimerase [Candidatus Latescibacterota bacterium]
MKNIPGQKGNKLSRRKALKTGALAAATVSVSLLAQERKSHAQETRSDTKNMHLSLAAYSMRDALNKGLMDLFGFIDWCAEMDLPGTELTSYYFKKRFDNSYLRELKRHALRSGVTISGTAIRNNFCLPSGPEKQKEIDHVKKWIDYSVEFFAPHIRIFAGTLPDGVAKQKGIGWVADGIKEALDYAADRGIMLGLENHGGITARAADHLAICDAVGKHPWFGINLDTGNYRTNCYEELAMAAPRAVNVQVKVEVFENDGTKVLADLGRVRDILVDAGYKGWIALEYEAEGDPRKEIPIYIEQMKRFFNS